MGVGFFAPSYALARPLLAEILQRDREQLAAGMVVSASLFAGMQTVGLILGSSLVGGEDLPYLEASLVDVILLLFAFVIVSTDFPEYKEKKQSPAVPKTEQKAIKVPALQGKFAEFTSEEPSEEHKDEEEVPSYLQPFASPIFPKLQVLKGLFSEEADDPQSLTLDSQIRESEGQPEPTVKRTHISFVEEDLKEAESKSGPVEDPFRMEGKVERLRTAGFWWSLVGYLGLVGLGTAVEYAGIYWLAGELSPKQLGTLLICSSGGTALFQFFIMSKCAETIPLNSLSLYSSALAALSSIAFPYCLIPSAPLITFPLLLALLLLRNISLHILYTTLVLRISDRVTTDLRPRALAVADACGAFAKAGGVILGPGVLAWTELLHLSHSSGLAIGAGVGFGVVIILLGTSRSHYQRFNTAPYRV